MVMAVCAGAQFPVMLTLAAPVSLPSASPAGSVVLNRFSADPTLGPYNATGSLQTCHGQTGAALFLIDRSRFFVQTLNGTPWLMLDTGRDLDGDGVLPPADQDDLLPVAKNVLDMQVAYALDPCPSVAAGPDADGDWMIGDTKGTQEEPLMTTNPPAPVYGTASTDPLPVHPERGQRPRGPGDAAPPLGPAGPRRRRRPGAATSSTMPRTARATSTSPATASSAPSSTSRCET